MSFINRRTFLGQTAKLAAFAACDPLRSLWAGANTPLLTSPKEIEKRVKNARPQTGGTIPANFMDRLGLTHYDGHYHLTDQPFLIEGAEAIHRLGFNTAKFWLREDGLPGYGYNSQWGIPLNGNLVDVISHPYYLKALSLPFKTVLLEVFPIEESKLSFAEVESDYAQEETQFYQLASYLLKEYRNRDITFILQNWEGDWMLRRSEGDTWDKVPPAEAQLRCKAFVRFLSARQRGVDRARGEAGPTNCKVYHAAEVNRVWDSVKGLPTVMTDVLPHVTVDLVSWSSYDGMSSAVETWQGIELIRHYMRPSPTFGKNAVFLGEIGLPENGKTASEIVDWWDRAMGVCFALDVPWIVHWELYCNEPKDLGTKSDRRPRKADELRGFWFIRPDGTLSHSGNYLTALLQNRGGKLPKETVSALKGD